MIYKRKLHMNSRKHKAFTLIELIVTLAIFIIVLNVLFPFFITSYKGFNTTEIKSHLQSEGESIMSYFSKDAMEAKEISNIIDINDMNSLDKNQILSMKSIEFVSGDGDINGYEIKDGVISQYKRDNKDSPKKIGKMVGKDIKAINIYAVDGKSFSETSSVRINILMKNKDVTYEINNTLYFRNK
ncbi:PilW family protein [Clostridium algidicarnis]|uniref:PilW family protein n=1 Tax=Clostridium algidicarnis TaxID=37659 RepID=UPI0016232006|nr:type II secretion system protein [Clostridium algidicarnis]MBB6632126.1 type II secretion system protein [Clostridium algidicarnis]